MGSLGKQLFDQQFQDVEGEIDIVEGLGPMKVLNIETSMNNVNITQQIAMLDATSDDRFTAPHKNFELSAFTDNTQGKIFKDDLTNPFIDDSSARIDINFSKLGSNRSVNDDLDEIDRYLDASRPQIVGPSFSDCSQYIEVDLNTTNIHIVPTNDSDMSITDTIHSPKKELSKSLSVTNKSKEDWVVDKENIVVNPYVTPAESDNFAVNEELEKVLVFDGKKLKYANIDADIDDVVENKPSNKSILNKTSQNEVVDMSFTKALPSLKRQTVVFDKDDLDADISMTQCISNPLQISEVINKKAKRQTIVFDQNNEDADISMTQCIVNVAHIESQNTGITKQQTIVYDDNDIDADISMTQCIANPVVNSLNGESNTKRQTIVFDRDNIDADVSMTACISHQEVKNQVSEISNSTNNKRQTIVFDTDDGKGDLSMTQCIRNNISQFVDLVKHPFSKAVAKEESVLFSQPPDEESENKRQTIHFADDNCDISMTQCIPNDLISNISKVVADRNQPALNVDGNEDYSNLSVTQCVSKGIMDSHNVEIPVYPVSIVFEKDEKAEVIEANKSNVGTKTTPPNNEEDQRSVTETVSDDYQDCEKIPSEEFLDFNAEDAVKDNNKWPETGFFYERSLKSQIAEPNKTLNLDEIPQEADPLTSASTNECSQKETAEPDGHEENKDTHMIESGDLGQSLANDDQNITVNFSLLKSSKRDHAHIDLTNSQTQEKVIGENASSSKTIELSNPEKTQSETSAVAETKIEEENVIDQNFERRNSMLNDLLKMSSNDIHDVKSKSSANETRPNQSSNMLMILGDSEESNINAATVSELPKSACADGNVMLLKDAYPRKLSETNSPNKTSLHQLSADSNLSKTIILKKESSSVDTNSVTSNNYPIYETKYAVKKFADEALQIGKSLSDISSDFVEKKEFGVYINSDIINRETSYNTDSVILAAIKINERELLRSSTSDASRMSHKKAGSSRSSVQSIADDVSKRKKLQEALKIHDNLDDVIPESATSVPKKKIVRMSDNIRKTLNFDDDTNESLALSSKTMKSALKKTVFGETSYVREDFKFKVIPNFEVTDNVKEIMKDLVQPMADVSHRDLHRKPSLTTTEIQANLLSSSQLDMSVDLSANSNIDMLLQELEHKVAEEANLRYNNLDSTSANTMEQNSDAGFRSPRKEMSQRVRFENDDDDKQIIPPLDTVLIFDPQNPLNNILLSRGYTEVHKYNPKPSIISIHKNADVEEKQSEEICERINQKEEAIETEKTSHESMQHKDEDSIQSAEAFLITEIRDSEVNTRISMTANKKLLKENASLANISLNSHRLTDIESVKTDTNIESEESDMDAKTRKRSYSPDKNAQVKTPKPAKKAPKTAKSPKLIYRRIKTPRPAENVDVVIIPSNAKHGKVISKEMKDESSIVNSSISNLRQYKQVDDLQFDENVKSPPGRRKTKQKKSTKIKLPNTDISVHQTIVEMSSPHQQVDTLEQFLAENGFEDSNVIDVSMSRRNPSPVKSTGDAKGGDQDPQWNPALPPKMQHILDEISYNVIAKIDNLGFMG